MSSAAPPRTPGTAGEVFRAFLLLGLSAFGGPVAHVGYFRAAFVARRGWLDDAQFAQLLAICQVLPGPASSQLGFGIGLLRAGWAGAAAAFVAFTLPSALLMLALVWLAPAGDAPVGAAVVRGLKLVAVAVVAHGLIAMARQLAPDARRAAIAVSAALLVLASGAAWAQLGAIVVGAALGILLCRHVPLPPAAPLPARVSAGAATAAAVAFAALLALALAWTPQAPTPGALAAVFYRAGALVFGGGHVVLPLLEAGVVAPGWLDAERFLAGYGAAQAMPGPMFTLAAYLGGATLPGQPLPAALAALAGIFLPGFLLLVAALPAWSALARRPGAVATLAGINAAVIGLLAAALYDPVLSQGIGGSADAAIAAVGLLLLVLFRLNALWVVAWCVGASLLATAVA
ncbi:chromate efflux transporter [Coralloluteibacterium thermophilus]|uniref:Chromate efflux transporter n=1 Tax=Coralloluteibacterium thermophilum TaxID=2707049 RepID=A0ABV9NQX7_9GAMM